MPLIQGANAASDRRYGCMALRAPCEFWILHIRISWPKALEGPDVSDWVKVREGDAKSCSR